MKDTKVTVRISVDTRDLTDALERLGVAASELAACLKELSELFEEESD